MALRSVSSCRRCIAVIAPGAVFLRRAFGSWPPPGFESLTGDQVAQFWKSLKDKHGDDLKLVAKEFPNRVTETGEAWNEGGTFQPLGYYTTLGYDIEKSSSSLTRKTSDRTTFWE